MILKKFFFSFLHFLSCVNQQGLWDSCPTLSSRYPLHTTRGGSRQHCRPSGPSEWGRWSSKQLMILWKRRERGRKRKTDNKKWNKRSFRCGGDGSVGRALWLRPEGSWFIPESWQSWFLKPTSQIRLRPFFCEMEILNVYPNNPLYCWYPVVGWCSSLHSRKTIAWFWKDFSNSVMLSFPTLSTLYSSFRCFFCFWNTDDPGQGSVIKIFVIQ